MPVMPDARIAALAGPPLKRPTMAKERARKLLPRAGLVEQRAKQHEQEDEADRNADGDAEDGLTCQPLITDQPASG